MSLYVTLTDEERRLLINNYKGDIKLLDDEIALLSQKREKAAKRLEEFLELEKKISESDRSISIAYSIQMTTAQKAEYALRKLQKISTTRDMAEVIFHTESGSHHTMKISDWVSNIGATLKQKVDKDDTFVRYVISGEIRYGLREWLKEDGKLKHAYLK